jgi:hypothetical protein
MQLPGGWVGKIFTILMVVCAPAVPYAIAYSVGHSRSTHCQEVSTSSEVLTIPIIFGVYCVCSTQQ